MFLILINVVFAAHLNINGVIIDIKNIPGLQITWDNATMVTDNPAGKHQIKQTEKIAENSVLNHDEAGVISSCLGISKKFHKKFQKNYLKNFSKFPEKIDKKIKFF